MVYTWFPADYQAGRNFVELGRRNPNDNHEKTSLTMNLTPLAWICLVPYCELELEDKPQFTVPILYLKSECFCVNNDISHMSICIYINIYVIYT